MPTALLHIDGDGGDFIQGDGILKPGFYEILEETLNGNDVLDGGRQCHNPVCLMDLRDE